MHFQTSSLHPPDAPLSRQCFLLQAGFASDSLWRLSAVRRTSLITRSLVSRIWPYRVRIEGSLKTLSSIGCLFTSSCSPPHLAVTQLLSVRGGKLRHRGTFTLLCMLSLKRTSSDFQSAWERDRRIREAKPAGSRRSVFLSQPWLPFLIRVIRVIRGVTSAWLILIRFQT